MLTEYSFCVLLVFIYFGGFFLHIYFHLINFRFFYIGTPFRLFFSDNVIKYCIMSQMSYEMMSEDNKAICQLITR